MLTIPADSPNPAASQSPAPTTTILVIGRSEKVLKETVDLLRQRGWAAGATNDFDNVLTLFEPSSLNIVVFGGMVPPNVKETLRTDLAAANPAITFVQGLAGMPGLLVAQVEAALAPTSRHDPESISYDGDSRTVAISLQSPAQVRVTGFWGTAFIPPDPESTSEVVFDTTLGAGTHAVPLPSSFPSVASFIVVHVDTDVFPFTVGPMPRGTTMTSPPA